MTKRLLSLLLGAALVLGLISACAQEEDAPTPSETEPSSTQTEPSPSASEEAEELSCTDMVMSVWMMLELSFKNPVSYSDLEQADAYIESTYGLSEGGLNDATIVRDGGTSPVELAVLRFADEDAATQGYDRLGGYLQKREEELAGSAPEQAGLVANAALVSQGQYVGMFIVNNSSLAEEIFMGIIETGKLPEPEPQGTISDVNELLGALLAKCEVWGDDISGAEKVDSGNSEKLKTIVEGEYGLDSSLWSEAAVARGPNGSVFEIAVLRTAEGTKPWDITKILVEDYLDVKEEEYIRFPVQEELLGKAVAVTPHNTDLVVMAVCGDPDWLMTRLISLTGTDGYSSTQRHWKQTKPDVTYDPNYPDRELFTPPNEEDMSLYDTSAILSAWEKGDPAGLSDYDKEIYSAAEEILDEIITDGMTDLEKENAVYTWLTSNVDYDWRHTDIMSETPRSSYEPYGGLVDRMAVCLGYATSFQLLMDMAGIECVTVVGAAFHSTGDHAWNVVKLGGKWYCVDVTWDANGREQMGEEYQWRYFNVTSDEMAKDHQWDYVNVPEAVTEGIGKA